jgi:hypothetical protein
MLKAVVSKWLRLHTSIFVMIFALVSLPACAWIFSFDSSQESPTNRGVDFPNTDSEIQQIILDYSMWTPNNRAPHYVIGTSDVAGLCRMPTQDDENLAESVHGGLWLKVYVNSLGLAAMQQNGERQFPVGTVIVKEKLLKAEDTSPFAVGMMIKRPAGSNPASEDWEFLYQERAKPLARGETQLPNCQACHSSQQETDSVFTVFLAATP